MKSPINIEYQEFSADTYSKSTTSNTFIKAQIELTYGCNLHCLHCYTDPFNRPDLLKKELTFEEVTQVLDKLHNEGILWVTFTGGEIFMRKDFLQIYDYAFQKGFIITLLTNGTLFSQKIIDHFCEFRPFAIEITLLGSTAKTFDEITQVPGSFKRCIEGIEMVLANKLPLRLKTSALKQNKEELNQIKEMTESYGLDLKLDTIIYPRLDGDTSSTDHRLSAEEIVDLEFSIGPYRFENKEAHDSCEDTNDTNPQLYRCGCGKVQAHVDPYGRIGACTWQRENRFDFRQKKVQKGMETIAKHIQSKTYSPESTCRDCQVYAFCEKMPETAAYESENVQDPIDYFCDVAYGRANKLREIVKPSSNEDLKLREQNR